MTVEDVLRERWKTASFKYRKAILIVLRSSKGSLYGNSQDVCYTKRNPDKFMMMLKQYNG